MKVGAIFLILIASAMILSTGCATGPEQATPGPYPDGYTKLTADYLAANLKDPYSARIVSFQKPVQHHFWFNLDNPPGIPSFSSYDAWASCVTLNARNGFGGYAGNTDYTMTFKDNGGSWDIHMLDGCEL